MKKEAFWGYAFISPCLLGLLWILGPMIYSAWLSLNKWDVIGGMRYIGLENFKTLLFDDQLFRKSLGVTFYYSVVAVPLGLTAGFLLALLLNTKIRGMAVFRTIYYLPSIVPQVANAILWVWIFNPEFGILNGILAKLGFSKILWLQDERWVMPALWLMGLWGVGGGMVIYLAGLQGIPEELYEAAAIDGANWWNKFWYITIPQMSPILFFNLIMGIIGSLQIFTMGYLMTDGGPNNATLFYVLYLYRNAFQWLKMGYAAALAWILFGIILILSLFIFHYLGKKVYYEDVV